MEQVSLSHSYKSSMLKVLCPNQVCKDRFTFQALPQHLFGYLDCYCISTLTHFYAVSTIATSCYLKKEILQLPQDKSHLAKIQKETCLCLASCIFHVRSEKVPSHCIMCCRDSHPGGNVGRGKAGREQGTAKSSV